MGWAGRWGGGVVVRMGVRACVRAGVCVCVCVFFVWQGFGAAYLLRGRGGGGGAGVVDGATVRVRAIHYKIHDSSPEVVYSAYIRSPD